MGTGTSFSCAPPHGCRPQEPCVSKSSSFLDQIKLTGFDIVKGLPLPTGTGYLDDFGTLRLAKAEIGARGPSAIANFAVYGFRPTVSSNTPGIPPAT